MSALRIGVDLGGTKIEAIALGSGGRVLANRRLATPRGDYEATLEAIRGLIAAIDKDIGAKATVGLGMPGALSPAGGPGSGTVKNSNSTWLIGKPFGRDLARALGREVRIANDADCFALSEATDGAGAGATPVFGVILGTGVGGGIVIEGRLLAGTNAIAGEWGHNPLPWPADDERPGPPCYCGQRGCIETFVSGPGLAADHAAAAGMETDPADIARRAGAGEQTALDSLARYRQRLARALAGVINILDPQIIVLGGGLSMLPGLCEEVPALWEGYVFSERIATKLVLAKFGDASGVRGAAWLWPEDAGS